MIESTQAGDAAVPAVQMRAPMPEKATFGGVFHVECHGADGALKWTETVHNTVTTLGKNDILNKYFAGSSYTAAIYVGLKNTGTIAAADTSASHAGWTENATYSNGTRPAFTAGTASAGALDNSASKAVFSINGTTTIYGAFAITNSTVSGTTGILINAADFGASRAVISGDSLSVQITYTLT